MRDLASKVMDIAKEAGKAIMVIYGDTAAWEVEKKSDNSPLTKADRRANKVICKGLEDLPGFHRYPIVSEENKEIAYEIRKTFSRYWLVDPLDGTKEFIKRNGEFTVNIALIEDGKPILGVVYVPALDEMYWAATGQGAWKISGEEETKLKAKTFKLEDSGLKLVCSRSHLSPETEAFVSKFKEPELVSKGSSLKFLILATGEADIYPRLAPTMEWDTGAAQVVLEEAGGKVLQWEEEVPVAYNKENLLNPFFVAYGNLHS
ncbi:MAG: 3'(2'),5'-bisphosphate nucleotidase CysQ [Saprospiraceae bacterium]|nr:3'(2'),5'-bisphosphate nucleotidase CysQ [Saprospiraceae bacterium]